MIRGCNLTEHEIALVDKNLIIVRNSHSTGFDFVNTLSRLCAIEKPSLVFGDPLLSYIGDDVSKQSVCSQFLRNWIQPVLEASGVCLFFTHHTNKPPGDAKARKGWTAVDKAYLGAGSAELVNWARAVCILMQVRDSNFDFLLAKRGMRAGALDLDLNRTTKLKLAHSTQGICWEQIAEKTDEEKAKSPGRAVKTFDVSGFAPG